MSMSFVKTNYKPGRNFTNIFDELLNDFPAFGNGNNNSFPPVNIVETADAYHQERSAPLRNKEDFKAMRLTANSSPLATKRRKKQRTTT